jgi:PAS domain S-box-containing protein
MKILVFLKAVFGVWLSALTLVHATLVLPPASPPALPKSISVVLDDDYPPFIFRQANGEFQGVLKDTWALWQARTGVEVKFLPMNWLQAQQLLQAGRADVIDTIFQTPARQHLYDFSKPYVTLEVPIFFHKNISGIVDAASLKGFTVGVKEGDACIDSLLANGVDNLKRFSSYSAVVSAAAAGMVRVFCMDHPPGLYLLNQVGLEQDFRHTTSLFSGQFHRAVRKGDAATLALVERGFASITEQEYKAIEDKWFGTRVDDFGSTTFTRNLLIGFFLILLLALFLMAWSFMLRRRVNEKTQVLADALTDLERSKQTSEQALSRLQAIAARVPGMVFQFLLRPDGSSCFPFASEAIRDIYRVTPLQVLHDASSAFAIGHPDDLPGVIDSIQESARNLTPWRHEYRVRFADGTVRWLFGNSLPQRLDDGSVLWHGFVTDITESRASAEKLNQLSLVAEQAPIAIVITDLQGGISYANPSFTRITGYSQEDVLGKNPRILQSGLTPQAVYVELWQTLVAGAVWQGELQNRKKNGEVFIENAVIAPVLDENGVATHYVALKQDITRRKQAEQMLVTSLKEKVALLHEVHHRVKNNLQVISSLLRLESNRSNQPDTKAVLKEMQGRIYAMALLHEALYRAGNFAWVDLAAYLKQLATQAFRVQSVQGGAVRLVLALEPCKVSMEQATPCGLLVNELLANALKHAFPAARSGLVTLTSKPAQQVGFWQICLSDNGVGLPEDFVVRRTQSLGLQLVSDLALQLGGRLEVEPVAPTGVQFCAIFPHSSV